MNKEESIRRKYKEEIEITAEASRRLADLGYVASHGGNLSYRVSDSYVLITPTKVAKRTMQADDIVIVDMDANVVSASNGRKPTGETPMHLLILSLRPDLHSVVHAHPPVLTGFSMVDTDILQKPLLPEPVLELGPIIPVPYAEPISDDLADKFRQYVDLSNAWLMKNHGITIGCSDNVERAVDILEMAEAMAMSVVTASSLGSVTTIEKQEVNNLENTIRRRGLIRPGNPNTISSLTDLYKIND